MTFYLVMQKVAGAVPGEKGGGHWLECGEEEATSSKAAIAAYLTEHGSDDGTYAAVPARSFKPVTVKAEKKLSFK